MDHLKNHYEKIALGLLLAFLTYAVISQIVFVQTTKSWTPEWKVGKDAPSYKATDEAYSYDFVKAEGARPFGGKRYLHCLNAECFSIMHDENSQCPWCGHDVIIDTGDDKEGVRDDDEDGMPTSFELEHDLDPKDPADAKLDKDEDGFTNLEEFKGKTNPTNPKDFPALASRLVLRKVYNLYLDFVVDSITPYSPEDKTTWEIQIKEKKARVIRGRLVYTYPTAYKKIGDTLPGDIKLLDASDSIDEGSSVTLQQGEEKFVVKANSKKIMPPDSERALFEYVVAGKAQTLILKLGEEFTLKGKNGVLQEYVVDVLDLKAKKVILVDATNSEYVYGTTKKESAAQGLDQFLKGL